jgi:dCTP diphosphatase
MIEGELLETLLAFRRERDWEQFHTPKNLSAAICVEAAELLEQFQWARDAEVAELVIRERESIENEIADIAIFLTYLCADLNVSLPDIVRRKVDLNRKKYPPDKAKGTATKYDRLR